MLKYLRYILKHKWYVFIECVKLAFLFQGSFWNLIWRGVIHDLSKFSPQEFLPYCAHFGYLGERKKKNSKLAFKRAWLNHIHRNDHHHNHWVSVNEEGPKAVEMPLVAILEMVADWHGMGHTLRRKGTTLDWYNNKRTLIHLAPATRILLESILKISPGPDYSREK